MPGTEEGNEYLTSRFTLSRFWKKLMMLAVEQFPEEYAVRTKSLGKKCKLFVLKQWSTRSWMEIGDQATLVRLLKDQMEIKNRVVGNKLAIKLAFGRAKHVMEFKSEEEFNNYVDLVDGEALDFFKNCDAMSPYVESFGSLKRTKTWSRPTQITKMIGAWYTIAESKLHYGFCREHGESFYSIVSANLAHKKKESPFIKYIITTTGLPHQ